MSNTSKINFAFGHNVGVGEIGETMIAPRGFTASTLKFPVEGQLIEAELELIDDFSPPANIDVALLTLQSLSVPLNAHNPVVLAIRPTNSFVYKEKASGVVLQTSENSNTTSNQISLGRVKIGDDDLTLGGTISAYVAPVNGVDSSYITSENVTSSSTVNVVAADISGNNVPALAMSAVIDYGHWHVNVTIPACLTDYEPFVLSAGTTAPDDETFQDPTTGQLIKLSDMTNVVTVGKKLIQDFVVTPSKHSIVKPIETSSVTFPSGSTTMENLLVSVGDYDGGSVILSDSMKALYTYGKVPKYEIKLPRGTVSEMSFTVDEGSRLPSGYVVATGSSVSDALDGSNRLELGRVRASSGYILQKDTELNNLVSIGDRVHIPAGLNSTHYQVLPSGMRTLDPLTLDSVIFPATSSLESKLTLNSDVRFDQDVVAVVAARKSLFKKGSLLKKGSISLEGALVDGDVHIDAASTVNDKFDIVGPYQIMASTGLYGNGGVVLKTGATLKAPFTLPSGFVITSGNVIPGTVKILTSMGVSLSLGQELLKDTHFNSSAELHGDIGFSPKGVIPAQATLSGSFTLPTGTEIDAQSNFGFSIPIPSGHSFSAGSVLPTGVVFKDGAKLPKFDPATQAGPAYKYDVLNDKAVGSLSKFTDSGETYLVIKGGSTLVSGFVIPDGSILSKVVDHGKTGSLSDAASGTAGDMIFEQGEYSADAFSNSPAAVDVTLTAGTATSGVVKLLTSAHLTSDLLVKLSKFDPASMQYLRMGEQFQLINDLELESSYQVEGVNTTFWAPNRPTPSKFTLTVPFSFTATPQQTLNKAIKLNVRSTADYVHGIVNGSTSYIKFPPGHTLTYPIKLAEVQPVANSGALSLKSGVDLPVGTKLLTELPVKLTSGVIAKQDFVIGNDISDYPAFTVQGGMQLLAGHAIPGDLSIRGGQGLPKAITLSSDVILTSDHVVKEQQYTVVKDCLLKSGSQLAIETFFLNGFEFHEGVTIDPILSLTNSNRFAVLDKTELDTDLTFPYTLDNDKNVVLPKFDARGLKVKLVQLAQQIEELLARQ